MKPTRFFTVLYLLFFCTPLYAELQKPTCEKVNQWASGYNASDIWMITPYVRFPGIARDEAVVPLFGKPVAKWSGQNFSQFNQIIVACRREAARARKQAVVMALDNARRAIQYLPRYTQRMQASEINIAKAVRELSNAPNSKQKKAFMHEAERTLHGRYNHRKASAFSRQVQTHLRAIANGRRYLTPKQMKHYSNILSKQYIAASEHTNKPVVSGGTVKSTTAVSSKKTELHPPTLSAGRDVRSTRIEGVSLGMSMNAAIAILEKKGYKIKRHAIDVRKLALAMEYPVDTARMIKEEVEPFPGGKMTREEARAYQTRNAIAGLKTRNAYLEAFKGRVVSIGVNGSTFKGVDLLKKQVNNILGKADKESGYSGMNWSMRYYQDPAKRKRSDTQLDVDIRAQQYTDMVKQKNVPYTFISYSVRLCQVYPECVK